MARDDSGLRGNRRFEPLTSATCCGSAQRTRSPHMGLPWVIRRMLEEYGEHFHHVAVGLRDRSRESNQKTVLVASCHRGEGCTTMAIALAVALAELEGHRVLLVDADFAAPAIAPRLGLHPSVGLNEVVQNDASLEEAILRLDSPPLHVLPLTRRFDKPAELAADPNLPLAMDLLREEFDQIIVDAGSLFAGQGPAPLIAGIDAALLVRQPALASEHLLAHLEIYLRTMDIATLGLIENGIDQIAGAA